MSAFSERCNAFLKQPVHGELGELGRLGESYLRGTNTGSGSFISRLGSLIAQAGSELYASEFEPLAVLSS